MESSTSRTIVTQKRQQELRAQIAALEAQLAVLPEGDHIAIKAPNSPKRKEPEPSTLVPATPSPKKKRRVEEKDGKPKLKQPIFQKRPTAPAPGAGSASAQAAKPDVGRSQFLEKLSKVKDRTTDSPIPDAITRTSAFSDRTRPEGSAEPSMELDGFGVKRDDRLALVEDIERGPYEFTPPTDDPDFQQLEPHSGIRLSSRSLSYEDFQLYMDMRYYLSPSRLYSVIRIQPDKQGYDVPLFGDWVTIAVVAERGPVKLTRAPVTMDPDEPKEKKKTWQKGTNQGKGDETRKPTGKKFVNFKLVDFGARSKSSADGAQSVIRGDAFLTLLLFEADGYDFVQMDGDKKPRKRYKGGSHGAFEAMAKVKEGDVIALLNPKILKPFQRSQDTPHPVNNILALTPESADSIAVIGRSRDLGMCSVVKRDGKPCGSWCDKRIGDVCEYHLQNAVQHRRAGRAEFTAGTSGMSSSSSHKRKSQYDPARQWGLKPEESARGSTYIISGHVVGGANSDPRNMYVGETMGREGQAKAQRKSAGDADRALKTLLERDRDGMRAVMLAREATQSSKTTGAVGTTKTSGRSVSFGGDDLSEPLGKSAYKAEVVKQLGFDPTLKAGQQMKADNPAILKKLNALESVRNGRKDIALGPRPGPKIRSGVMAPPTSQGIQAFKGHRAPTTKVNGSIDDDEVMIDLDED
ncbi:hypothetical protein Agabi119p4_11374 [Agaricus bisporus var. burnettii]|uniref:Zinc finger Mcm10/DnaG-type domain-containing protein n=1 Tax=Agaricus bisporus var. burnettii TaxID=192524 RepID=A0A8H7C146_AGABI|nr:hypothetical protein Agabi119p4_11374 [Agaricus bisporus var. burnettii]